MADRGKVIVTKANALLCLCRVAAHTRDPVLGRLALELFPPTPPSDGFSLVIEAVEDEF